MSNESLKKWAFVLSTDLPDVDVLKHYPREVIAARANIQLQDQFQLANEEIASQADKISQLQSDHAVAKAKHDKELAELQELQNRCRNETIEVEKLLAGEADGE